MVLTSHLPWILHLLLLTDVGRTPDDSSSDRAVGVNNEGSENLSATTVQHIASSGSRGSGAPGEDQWEAPRSADSHSVKHERLSISMASNATGDDDKVIVHDKTATSSHSSTMGSGYLPRSGLCSMQHFAAYLRLVHVCRGLPTGKSVPEV